MADYYGVNTTLLYGGGAQKVGAGKVDGRVKNYSDYYTIGGSVETAGKTIMFGGYGATAGSNGQLVKGAMIIAILLSVSVAQSSLTVNVGNLASATAFGTALTGLQTANLITLVSGLQTKVGDTSGDDCILITTGGATMTAGVLYCTILFSKD